MSQSQSNRRVLLVGFDAADWQFINPLLDAGLLPAIRGLVEQGVMGNLASLQPMLSPIVWTSLATGKRADAHGILSFLEPLPDGSGVQPAASTSRKTRAIWNLLTHAGQRVHSVGWYASHPAEPINGICVSEQFVSGAAGPAGPDGTWPMPADAVHPPELADAIAALRVRPEEIGDADLLPFVPQLGEIDPAHPKLAALRQILAKAASVHAAATAILDSEPWDFLSVFYDAIDFAGHLFMPLHPPAMANADPREASWFGGVMRGIYQFHDLLLARLMHLAGEDATVILVSDHGFYCDHRRPRDAGSTEAEQAAAWHRPLGVFAMMGPGVKQDERVYGASVLDVTPTILSLFDQPVGRDMPGRVLASAFESEPQVQRIASWDDVNGHFGEHPPQRRTTPIESAETVRQLVELGYLAAADAASASLVQTVLKESRFNLAVTLLTSDRADLAADTLEPLVRDDPQSERYVRALAHAYVGAQRDGEAIALLSSRLETLPTDARALLAQTLVRAGRRDEARSLATSIEGELSMTPRGLQALALLQDALGDVAAAEATLGRAVAADADLPDAWYALAALQLHRGDATAAAESARRATRLIHGYPAAHRVLGSALERLGDFPAARRAYETALALDPGHTPARDALIHLHLRLGDLQSAQHLRHSGAGNHR
jgi:predicted AlkP superfamily phosphohydrolase/phosphomutase/tetratricopeptide (TPR) repeat protein